MAKFRLQLLGAFRLQTSVGEPVPLPTKKSKALLAYLALGDGQLRPRSTLAGLLWEDAGEQQSRESLRQTLSLLRKALLPSHVQPIISEGDMIALEPSALVVDALEFGGLANAHGTEMLATAANLYSGDLLEGFDLNAPAFERWLAEKRQDHHEKAVNLLSRLLTDYLTSGNLERAATTATRLLTLDPLRESSHRALMELYSKQGRYAAALRQYQICCDVLSRELNVSPEPATTALYRDIRNQRNLPRESPAISAGPRVEPRGDDHARPAPTPQAPELRPITVLSCELTGLGAFSASADPEEVLAAVAACSQKFTELIGQFGGHIESFSGDRFTALFGFPHASEHSTEQAIRAGLAVAEEANHLEGSSPLKEGARVGIATSAVVTGNVARQGTESALALIGEAPRIASILQTIAPAKSVLISIRTKDLVGDLFDYAELPEIGLGDTADIGPVWRVVGETRSATRFGAKYQRSRSPFVGRETERERLLEYWEWSSSGGQIAFLTGEPGIGKSRLAQQLREELKNQPHQELFYQCSPFHSNSALYPFLHELERAADLHHTNDPEEKLAKLAALLSAYTPSAREVAPLFAELLSIPINDEFPPLKLSPAQQRRRTLSALLDRIDSFARKSPVLLLFEDSHWADASSLEVLDLLAERIRQLPVLLLVTSRPGFEPTWGGLEHVHTLNLDRIGESEARRIVHHQSPANALPAQLVDQIVARTDGIPLFVEELTQAVIESRLPESDDSDEKSRGGGTHSAIPDTLHDSLLARLDRLGRAKTTAQVAAVIGREFSEELLRSVAGPAAGRLEEDLEQLTQAGLIFEQTSVSGRSFIFKHGLVRDVAYQSMLKGRRQQLHGAIANAIRESFPAIEQNQPELVARHLTEAGVTLPALGYWLKGGMHASSRSAYREAIAHLEQGLELIPELSSDADKKRWERRLLAVMGPAVMALRGYAADAAQQIFLEACELIDADCPADEKLRILCGLWNLRFHRGELATALPLAEQILRLARESGLGIDLANCLMGQNLSAMGEFEKAQKYLREVIDCFRAGRRNPPVMFGVDESVLALVYMARVLWALGHPDQAAAAADEAMSLSRNGMNSVSVAVAYYGRMFIALQIRREEDTEALIAEATAHADEHSLPLFQNWYAFIGAVLRLRQGRDAEILQQMVAALPAADGRLSRQFRPFYLGCIAETHLLLGSPKQALACIGDALETAETTGENQSRATLHRIKGEILSKLGRQSEAEEEFHRALSVAGTQKAKIEELRAALGMLRAGCDPVYARDRLAQVYATFTEGLNLPDLVAAREALDSDL